MSRFAVYEIEHGADEAAALEALAAGGCKNLKVIRRDYENCEGIVVECEIPAEWNVRKVSDLAARFPELCF